MGKPTHTIMSHSLAKALMEAGMHHFDGGGLIGDIGGGFQGVAGDFTAQNGFQASAPDISQLSNQQQGVYNQQQSLANTLLNQSQGQGPNPAANILTQATNTNNQQAAGLVASQKGISPALAARMAAQTAASNNQTAAGQAGTMQAQQQLAATGQLAGVENNMAGQNLQGEGIQTQGQLGAEGINAQVAQNNANAVNKNTAGIAGGVLGGVGSALTALFAKGGEVPKHLHAMAKIYHPKRFASGGMLSDSPGSISTPFAPSFSNTGALSSTPAIGSGGSGSGSSKPSGSPLAGLGSAASAPGAETLAGGPMDAVGAGGAGSMIADLGPLALLAARGGPIPGKAAVKGNSYKNDTVPALLSPKEIVLPRSVTQSADAPAKAAEFVRHLQEQKSGKDDEEGYAKVASAKKKVKSRTKTLDKKNEARAA